MQPGSAGDSLVEWSTTRSTLHVFCSRLALSPPRAGLGGPPWRAAPCMVLETPLTLLTIITLAELTREHSVYTTRSTAHWPDRDFLH